MRVALIWAFWQHYHWARWRAFDSVLRDAGGISLPIALCSRGSMGHDSVIDPEEAERLTVLTNDPSLGGENCTWATVALLRALDRLQPDVVAIIGYASRASRAALGWCRRYRRGAVLMMETQESDLPRRWMREVCKRYLMRGFDAVLAGGKTHAAYARKLGMPAERIRTGYDVVDNQYWGTQADVVRLSAESWRRRLGLPLRYFLAAGRFIPKKNFAGLLEAFRLYVEQISAGEAWDLVLVGRGEEESRLRSLVSDGPLRERVHFKGYADSGTMAAYYGLASMFVMPSAFEEQWGLVVNEAMAAGLPVLVSTICGCATDLVRSGTTGFTFQASDTGTLAEWFVRTSRGKLPLKEMGRNARLHIAAFSPRVFAEGLLKTSIIASARAKCRQINWWPSLAVYG